MNLAIYIAILSNVVVVVIWYFSARAAIKSSAASVTASAAIIDICNYLKLPLPKPLITPPPLYGINETSHLTIPTELLPFQDVED